MTYQELVEEVKQLSRQEQLALLEVLTHTLLDGAPVAPRGTSSAERLLGILKTDAPAPTDEEVKEMYVDYLSQKYA